MEYQGDTNFHSFLNDHPLEYCMNNVQSVLGDIHALALQTVDDMYELYGQGVHLSQNHVGEVFIRSFEELKKGQLRLVDMEK